VNLSTISSNLSNNLFNQLAGKTALISGAGAQGGIGYAIAKAVKDAGATVFITSTTKRIYDRAKELGATGFVADLTQLDQCQKLISQISSLDILINNAGMISLNLPLSNNEAVDLVNVTSVAWQQGIARNLDTAFNLTKSALPLLRKSNQGRIIMISSVTGAAMAMANQPVYAAAKAALIGLTKSLALDEARYQITANAILPGWIKTDTQSDHEAKQGLKTPLKRSGTPDEIASLALYLSSNSASYLTGQAIIVDGGNAIVEERA
jgi:3-oxoacyl-[acyl-carrier protein] reductase